MKRREEMAQVVCLETDAGVAETIDFILEMFGISHVCCVVPAGMVGSAEFFREIFEQHQPQIVLVEPEYTPEETLRDAMRPLRHAPRLWAYTRLDLAKLNLQYPSLWFEKVFEKPYLFNDVANKLVSALGIAAKN